MAEYVSCQTIVLLCITLGIMLEASLLMNISSVIIVIVKNVDSNKTISYGPQYDWTSLEKNQLMGCTYIGCMFGEIIAGRLSDLYGPRIVHLISTLLSGLLTIIQPIAYSYGVKVGILTRVLLGFAISPCLPNKAVLLVNWFPPSERTRSAATISTFSLGVAGSFQLFALLLHYFNYWPAIFYINGGICVIWSFLSFFLIYDSPEKHPRISNKERKRIQEKTAIENDFPKNAQQKLPLLYIATSVPLLVTILTRLGFGCLHSFVMLQLTTYLNDVLHFSIGQTGFFSSLPFIGHVVWAYVTCYSADKLLISQIISKTNIRKLMECSYQIIVGFIMIILGVFGLNSTITVISFMIAGMVMGSHTAGHFSNIMDLAPNFSGTLIGFSAIFSSIGIYSSTLICGLLVQNSTSFEEWEKVFFVMAIIAFSFALLYGTLAKTEVQHWNNLDEYRKSKEAQKMLPLNEIK